jgi:hypothetical protein
MGHSIEVAMDDIIDNSIMAIAMNVGFKIHFYIQLNSNLVSKHCRSWLGYGLNK